MSKTPATLYTMRRKLGRVRRLVAGGRYPQVVTDTLLLMEDLKHAQVEAGQAYSARIVALSGLLEELRDVTHAAVVKRREARDDSPS